jgi:hypothetical protein
VEEPEQPASDDDPGDDVQPKPVAARLAEIDTHSSGEEHEADEDAHDRAPVASVRDQIRDEEVRRRREDEHEERKTEDGEREGGSHDQDKREEEPREVEALKVEVHIVEPADPAHERAYEDDERQHRRQREEARCEPVPRNEPSERQHHADRQDEQSKQGEPARPVLTGQHAQQRAGREENCDAAEVGEECRA